VGVPSVAILSAGLPLMSWTFCCTVQVSRDPIQWSGPWALEFLAVNKTA
jgi:hypothetical protein